MRVDTQLDVRPLGGYNVKTQLSNDDINARIYGKTITNEVKPILVAPTQTSTETPKELSKRLSIKPHLDLSKHRVDILDVYTEPVRAIAQTLPDGKLRTIGTLGNISMIIGKAKAKKSFLINMFISAMLGEGTSFGQLTSRAPEGKKKVLYIDTEQSKDMVHRAIKRIAYQTGADLSNLETLALRSLTPSQRCEVVEYAVTNSEGLGLVVIDGVSDLVTSINDEEQGSRVSNMLMRLSEEKNIHIMTVLHTNKGSNNEARGHIGTTFQNKAETTLEIVADKNDPDVSNVRARFSRDREIMPFSIRVDDRGNPSIDEDFSELPKQPKRKKTDITQQEATNILAEVFKDNVTTGLSYSSLISKTQLAYKNIIGLTLGVSASKQLKKQFTDNGLIASNSVKGETKYILANNQ